jgi:glycosyltransferase involved in cell wall biosynthesis
MKVLVVSHSYTVGVNQQKIQRLAKLPGISVALTAPKVFMDMGRKLYLEKTPDAAFRMYPLNVFWYNHLYVHFYDWFQLLRAFIKEKPDVLYIEEEPQSLATGQVLLTALLFNVKRVLLTWENLEVKFPLYKRLIAWWVLRRIDVVVGGTGDALATISKIGFKGKGFVNPQFGLDEDIFCPKNVNPLKTKLGLGNKFVIGFIARLTPEKGILTLIRAAAQIPFDFILLIVGDGPVKDPAVKLAAELGIENKVKWGGIISHKQLPEYMNCFDLFVLPSIPSSTWKEQFGHVVIEAMACQVPVIGSDCGAIPELIGDGGLVFPSGDESRLAAHIKALFDDPGLRKAMGARGRQRVLENYSDRVIVQKLYVILKEIHSEKMTTDDV